MLNSNQTYAVKIIYTSNGKNATDVIFSGFKDGDFDDIKTKAINASIALLKATEAHEVHICNTEFGVCEKPENFIDSVENKNYWFAEAKAIKTFKAI